MPIVSDRPVVIELARKRLAQAGANPSVQDREDAARGALFEHYRLVDGDGIWGASEAAICMGWSAAGEEENLLERIVADVAAELDCDDAMNDMTIHAKQHPEVDVDDVLAARAAAGEPIIVILPGSPGQVNDSSLIRHGEQFHRGPYGITSPRGNPLCEECDLEMAPFAGPCSGDGKTIREGWSCIGCGWSIDLE